MLRLCVLATSVMMAGPASADGRLRKVSGDEIRPALKIGMVVRVDHIYPEGTPATVKRWRSDPEE